MVRTGCHDHDVVVRTGNDGTPDSTTVFCMSGDDVAAAGDGLLRGKLLRRKGRGTYRPLSPKMSCNPSCTRSAKLGYFYRRARLRSAVLRERLNLPEGQAGTYVI